MTTTTGTSGDDGDVVDMEMDAEPARKPGFLTPTRARLAFIALACVAALAVVLAILAVVLAPANAEVLLWSSLGVLAIVVIAEVVLLLVAKPGQA